MVPALPAIGREMTTLPMVRSHERIDFKRCPKKWYWNWRVGLELKTRPTGALELGTWMHEALAAWYSGSTGWLLAGLFDEIATESILTESGSAPDFQIERAEEQRLLGIAMCEAYQAKYGTDPDVHVIRAELPLQFEITDEGGELIAIHKLKPDLVFHDGNGGVWLMEHKTAKQIRLEHLVIDDQARPYVSMAELCMRQLGLIPEGMVFRGVMYNFLRKALPDMRATNEKGQYLNKNGSVSKQQPTPVFVRHPVTLSNKAKAIALRRIRVETRVITAHATALRAKELDPAFLPKTPHSSCAKLCDYFSMCVVEEQGGDIREMQRNMYRRRNPYLYDEETTDIPASFELS